MTLPAEFHLCTLTVPHLLQGFPGDIGPPGENGPEGLKVSGAETAALCGVGSSQGKQSSGKGGREKPREIPKDCPGQHLSLVCLA